MWLTFFKANLKLVPIGVETLVSLRTPGVDSSSRFLEETTVDNGKFSSITGGRSSFLQFSLNGLLMSSTNCPSSILIIRSPNR